MDDERLMMWTVELLYAAEHMVRLRVLHRDIKPANILVAAGE